MREIDIIYIYILKCACIFRFFLRRGREKGWKLMRKNGDKDFTLVHDINKIFILNIVQDDLF